MWMSKVISIMKGQSSEIFEWESEKGKDLHEPSKCVWRGYAMGTPLREL